MRFTVGYSSKAEKEIPVRISFRCPYCNGENKNIPQRIKITGEASGSVFCDWFKLMQESGTKLQQEELDLGRKIDSKEYEKLNLQTTCTFCSKKQPWSSYCDKEKFITWGLRSAFVAFMVSVGGLGIASSTNELKYLTVPLILIIITVLIFCFPAIRKKQIEKEMAALPEECKPVISFYRGKPVNNTISPQ